MNKKINIAIALGHFAYGIPSLVGAVFLFILVRGILHDSISVVWHILAMVTTFFVTLGLTWFWWALIIPFWRIWAFQFVEKSHWLILKQKAIEKKLIWKDGSNFEQYEFRSAKVRAKIEVIDQEILVSESKQYQFDRSETPETMFFPMNLWFKYLDLIGNFFVVLLGLFGLWMIPERWILFAILLTFPILSIGRSRKLWFLTVKHTGIRLDAQGLHVQFPFFEIITWEDIEFIEFNRSQRELEIYTNRAFGDYQTIKLDPYRIGSLNRFETILEIFIDRHQIQNL